MAVKLRLKRMGAKKRPFYRIVAADSRSPRDGRFIEVVGTYNPILDKDNVVINEEKIDENYYQYLSLNPILKEIESSINIEKDELIDKLTQKYPQYMKKINQLELKLSSKENSLLKFKELNEEQGLYIGQVNSKDDRNQNHEHGNRLNQEDQQIFQELSRIAQSVFQCLQQLFSVSRVHLFFRRVLPHFLHRQINRAVAHPAVPVVQPGLNRLDLIAQFGQSVLNNDDILHRFRQLHHFQKPVLLRLIRLQVRLGIVVLAGHILGVDVRIGDVAQLGEVLHQRAEAGSGNAEGKARVPGGRRSPRLLIIVGAAHAAGFNPSAVGLDQPS